MNIKGLTWGTPIRKGITLAVSCLGAVAALGGAVQAWPDVEPLLPAQRYYVIERVAEYKPAINQLLRWKTEDRLDNLRQEKALWQSKLPTETSPEARAVGKRRLREIDSKAAELKRRLKELSE